MPVKHKKKLTLYSGRGQKRKQVTKVLRDLDILKMREEGMSYEAISEVMTRHGNPVSPVTCSEIVNRILRNAVENSRETIENVRQIELRRLDQMLETCMKMMKNGRAKAFIRLQAQDRILKIQERRARLLGLDVKQVVEHKGEVAVRVYHGVEPAPELELLEEHPPTEGEFEMIEGNKDD